MTVWLWWARRLCLAACSSACLGALAQDEVPFITTPDSVTLAMLQLAGVSAQDRVVDLGSGDGRIVITAARRFGARGLGVEIVPDLVAQSRANAIQAGVAERVEFRVQDLFLTPLQGATVVTMYLLPEVNLQLRPRLLALAAGTRIVSHDWDMGDWLPDRSVTLDVPDKAIGRDKRSSVHLWVVPAQVQGLWCSAGLSPPGRRQGEHLIAQHEGAPMTLHIEQRFQRFSATLAAHGVAAPVIVFDGRIDARTLHGQGATGEPRAELQLQGAVLRLASLAAPGSVHAGRSFTRAGAGGCAA